MGAVGNVWQLQPTRIASLWNLATQMNPAKGGNLAPIIRPMQVPHEMHI